MFTHVTLGTNDLDRAKAFYDATIAALGGKPGNVDAANHRLIYRHGGQALIVTRPINGEPATASNGFTLGFAGTREQVDAWHAAGLAHGGTTCEDPPGQRMGKPFYIAYLRDPDGNKLCALHYVSTGQ